MIIEDDQIEVLKLQRVVNQFDDKSQLKVAHNGEEALSMLQAAEILPDIVFLDLNMPKMNGLEFLKTLKSDDRLRFLPVVIMTTSSNPRDIKACYETGVAGYISKPLKYQEYEEKLLRTLKYWSINDSINQ